MGIDGIGGAGGPPKIGPSGGVNKTGGDFSVEGSDAPVGDSELDKLSRGEITRDEYLDGRVSAAMSHLEGSLSPEQAQMLREQLREQLETDPTLKRLLQRAGVPAAAEEDQ